MMKLLLHNGRPCEIIRSYQVKPKNPKWRANNYSDVRYLDGAAPRTERVTAGALKKAKAVRETETIYWRRADDLIRQGMDAKRAQDQARAELMKGLLSQASF